MERGEHKDCETSKIKGTWVKQCLLDTTVLLYSGHTAAVVACARSSQSGEEGDESPPIPVDTYWLGIVVCCV